MIYLDNAATTMKKPKEVVQAVVDAMQSMGNAGRGAHDATLNASRLVYELRMAFAEFFNAEHPRQIVFTANATESLNIAIKGILNPGDHVITTVMEHNSVLRPLYEMEIRGTELSFLPCNSNGVLLYEQIETMIQPNTKAIVCTHGSNLTGNLADIERIGAIGVHGPLDVHIILQEG